MLEPPRFDLTEINPELYRHLMQMEASSRATSSRRSTT